MESAPYSRLLASSVRKDVPGFPPTDTPRQFSKAPEPLWGVGSARGAGKGRSRGLKGSGTGLEEADPCPGWCACG